MAAARQRRRLTMLAPPDGPSSLNGKTPRRAATRALENALASCLLQAGDWEDDEGGGDEDELPPAAAFALTGVAVSQRRGSPSRRRLALRRRPRLSASRSFVFLRKAAIAVALSGALVAAEYLLLTQLTPS